MDPKWFNVNVKARIWSGHSDNSHKQGWMYPAGAILAIDEYKGSYQFEEWKVKGDGIADFYAHEGYEQLWIRIEDVSVQPYADPVPNPNPDPVPGDYPSNEVIGRVIRFLFGK